MATRTVELSGANVVPFTPVTAIDRENVTVTLLSAPSSVAPGDTVEITARIENNASSIPGDDPFFCRDRNGEAGVSVTVGGSFTLEGVGDPNPEVDRRAFCLIPGESRLMTVTFQAPSTTGTYIGNVTASWHDPPQLWGATALISVDVTEDSDGGGGGGFDPGAVSASCSLRSSVINEGDIGIVDVTVTNSNSVAASTSVNIAANGSILSTESIQIAPNDTLSFQTSVRDLSPGSYGIEVMASASPASVQSRSRSGFGLSQTRPLAQCDTC